jgi:hypothetical protein
VKVEPMTDAEMGVAPSSIAAPVEPLTDEQMGMSAEVKPMTDDEMATLESKAVMSGRPIESMREGFEGTDSVNALQAANTIEAARNFYQHENGWLENTFYTLTMAEQAVARQAVNVMENVGLMSTEDAREILASDQVHNSDLVNFYWKNPTGISGVDKTLKFVAGLAADILLDPLTYTGVGALTQLGKTATVGGKALRIGHLNKAQRAFLKTLEPVEKILQADGKYTHATKTAKEVAEHNAMVIKKAEDMRLGFTELEAELLMSPNARKQVVETIRVGTTEKSWAKEWYEGQRGWTFGARIPFTDVAKEVEMPGLVNKMTAMPLLAIDKTYNIAKSAIRKHLPIGDAAFTLVSDLGSRTGKFIFDVGQNTRFGAHTVVKDEMASFKTAAYGFLKGKKEELGDEHFPQLWDDIVNELDNGIYSKEEAYALADAHGVEKKILPEGKKRRVENPMVSNLYKAGQEDVDRMVRLSQHPDALAFIEDSRDMMKNMAEEFKKRDLPFEELNPFGTYIKKEMVDGKMVDVEKGWARRYLKRVVSQEYFEKMDDAQEAGSYVASVVSHDKALLGSVDTSSQGRAARAPVAEYQKAALNDPEYGVKMFIDDPADLVARRYEEMSKIIADHDMMKTALPYAIIGSQKRPIGYKLFSIDDYKRLAIKRAERLGEDGKLQAGWDAFIPKEFKTGQPVWLPEDIASRMDFNINGWDVDRPLGKILHAVDGYTNVWRNNALFGTSYIGMNLFSNALTYLSHNDKGGVMALAKATAAVLPDTMVGRGVSKLVGAAEESAGYVTNAAREEARTGGAVFLKTMDDAGNPITLSKEQFLREATEDNILGSTYTQGIEFRHVAEHLGSNRKARQDMGRSLKTVADAAYLWKFSRGMAQVADDIPKLAVYLSHREKGYSRLAAADAAEKLFYNFNNMSKIQSGVAKAIPFSSFPMKTYEMFTATMREGNLAGLTIPGKVQAILDGAFVQDHQSRDALDQMLPMHHNVLHPQHGEIAPGMRELMMDVPWTYSTMQTLFNPEDSTHPLFNILALAGAAKTKTEDLLGLQTEQEGEAAAEQRKTIKRIFAESLDLAIPVYLREALTLAELNGAVDLGGHFRDRYVATMPTESQVERSMSDRKLTDQSAIMHKFENASDFGAAVDQHLGDNWLYNFVFPERKEGSENFADMQDQGARGEYIRKRMRQFTGGVATFTKLDSNFFMNNYAIKRQIDMKTRDLKAQIVEAGVLMDTERISDSKFVELQVDRYPLAKEILALQYKKDALHDHYDFFLGLEKKMPNLSLMSIMFGMEAMDMESPDRPEKEVYDNLYKRKTMKNISDDDAQEAIDNIIDEDVPQQ